MQSHEEERDQSTFRRHSLGQQSINQNHILHSYRAREPITVPEMEESGNRMSSPDQNNSNTEVPPKESIDEQVSRIIMHENMPIENLPGMVAPELKLLGRCVSLSTKKAPGDAEANAYYYTGLVVMVTESTVTLAHVIRYTRADFKAYKSREQRLANSAPPTLDAPESGRVANNGVQPPAQPAIPSSRVLTTQGSNIWGAAGVPQEARIDDVPDTSVSLEIDSSGSLAPAMPVRTVEEVETEATQSMDQGKHTSEVSGTAAEDDANHAVPLTSGGRPRHLMAFNGSVGPIPYVTVLRKNIRDVEFGRDPHSSFYSLFQDPSRRLVDMQFLRMFVRRYLVHTSEGNNPRQVPLYAFLSVRCAWLNVDRELVNGIVVEELRTLLKADRAIAKESRRKRTLRRQQEQNVLTYRAPAGLFSRTGILHLTQIPQNAFLAGMLGFLFTISFALYLGVMLSTNRDDLVLTFISRFTPSLAVSIIFWGLGAIATLLGGITIHLPLGDKKFFFALVCLSMVGSLACCVMCVINFLSKMSNYAIYMHMAHARPSDLCTFYDIHHCSGYAVGCGYSSSSYDSNLCDVCPNAVTFATGCYVAIWSRLQLIVMPLLVLCIFIMIIVMYVLFLLAKLVLLAKALTGHFF